MEVYKRGSKIYIKWECEKSEDIKKAQELYNKLTRQGWLAAIHDGELKRILKFDPEYEELWFIPRVEGG
jgi:hypothetical protein